jgi:hypothetical protein
MASLLLGTTVGGHAVIHAGNIAAQSVNYANSAGSVAWTNVSGRPTHLSQFTNDLGNYGNWITASALSGYATQSWVQSYYTPIAYVTDSFVDFFIYGDENRYYPVTIHNYNGGYGLQRYSVHRGYNWQAPWDPIGTGGHKGGLTLTFEWTGDTAWGGNDKTIRVTQFGETYTQLVAGMQLTHCEGVVVWLRGGGSVGAHYRLHGPGGKSQTYSIAMSAWTSCAGVTYDVRSYDGSIVNTEINNRYPVRNNTELYYNNNIVATESWVQSRGYLTSLPSHNHDSLYVPLGRTITINGVTQDLSANRSFTVSTSLPAHDHDDRYYTEGESDGRFTRNLGFQAFVGSLNDLDGQYTVNLDGYGPINGYGGPDAAYNASLWGIGNRNRGAQIYIPYAYDQLYFRRGASDWSSWFRVLNTSADPYPSNMNQYLRTTDSPTFSSAISVTADGSTGYVASRLWLYSHNNYRGAGVYMSGTGSTWFAGTPYTNFDGVYMIGKRTNPSAPDAADPSYRLWQVDSNGSTYQTGDMSSTNVHAYASSNAKVVAGSWNFDGMLFDSGRPALIARGAYPHLELWADISNNNHGATIRLGGYDNGSSGNYKSWHIGTPGSDLYFMDIAYGGRNNPNPHAGIAGLGDSYSYPGAFNMMRFHNNGNIGVGNFGTYGSGDNTPAYKLDVRGNGRYTQLLYLDAAESLNLYGVRGRFTNEYIHLYNKVGVGHPGGWGQGEGNTPNQGLSTYGGINIAYGLDNGATINTYTRINKNWAGGDYSGEAFTIRGTYPSIGLRSTNHDSKWLIHHASELQFYHGGGADNNDWANKFSIPTNGDIWMVWANSNISTLLNAKQNASTAINTGNIGSQSVSNSSQLGGLTKAQLWNNSGQVHGTYQTFGAIPNFGVWFMQGSSAADTPQSGSQYYVQTQGLGNDYGYGTTPGNYALMTAVARDHARKYTYYRTLENGSWNAWSKGAAGYADEAGSVAWTNVSSRPTNLSDFTNDLTSFPNRIEFKYSSDRYSQAWNNSSTGAYWWVTTDADKLGYHRNGDGDKFYFSNGGDFYSTTNGWLSTALANKQNASTAINTSNIGSQSVNYAASAGSASNLQGYSAYDLVTESRGMHSGSDFPNGTLVRTDIDANGWAGDSFVMEVSGKSYGSGTPFKLVMEGYLYADTIINVSAMSYGSYFPGGLMVFRLDGKLCFWWRRGSYWNSFEVHVRAAGGDSWNRVTSIGDSADPGGDKRVECTPTQVVHSGNIGSQSVNYATTAGSANSVAWTNVSGRPTALSQFTNDISVTDSTKLPLAGGTMTGNLTLKYSTADADDYNALIFASGSDDYIIKASSSKGVFGRSSFGWHISSASAFGVYSSGWVQLLGVQGDSGNAFNKGRFVVGGNFSNNGYNSVDSTRLHFGGGDTDANNHYYIGTNKENYGGNYTKLDLRWHTGIRMGAQPGYGGIRFYNNETLNARIMSIGEGDSNVRIDDNLWIGGAGGWITDLLGAKQNNLGFTPYNATNPSGYITSSGSISGNAQTSNHLNATRDTPSGKLQYWDAPGLGLDEAPSGDWHNTIRMGHGSPLSYYSNTLAIRMTGSGVGDIYTQTIMNGNRQGWKRHWNDGNMDAPNKSGTSYYQTNTWMQFNGFYGLYWPSNYDAHLGPNDGSSYTQFYIRGQKNGYGGFYDNYSRVNGAMYDSGGNGGVYREANGLWYFYYHVGNNCMGVGTSTTSSSYKMYVDGTIYATGDVIAYSDSRKKTNIVTIDNALTKVLSMRGVFYDKIDELQNGRQVGVIAQEVNEILPEAVSYASDIDEYGVKYGNIVGVLIEAIKEQQKEIEMLKSKLN